MTSTRTLLTLIFCVSFFMSFSQETIEFSTGKTKELLQDRTDNWNSFVNVSGESATAAISFADRDSAYYYLVDSNFRVKSNYAIPRNSITNNYYNGTFNIVLQKQSGNIFTNYLQKPNLSIIYVEEENFNLHTSVFRQFLDFDRNEKFITAFDEDGHIYLVTVVKGTNKLRLYKDEETAASEIFLTIPAAAGEVNIEAALKNLKVIKPDKEADLNTATSKAKLYIGKQGKLSITIDDAYKFTILFSIDLGTNTAKTDMFMKNMFYCNNVDRIDLLQTNSYLYENKLVQGIFCPKDFVLSIKNIINDSALYTFHAQVDSSITFASSELIKREQSNVVKVSLFSSKKDALVLTERELKAKDFFKAVNRHEIAFVVVKTNNYSVLKIGESHDLYTNGGGGFYGGGFGAGGAGSAPVAPVYYGGYSSKSGQSETYFKTVFTNLDSAAIYPNDVDTKSDKIDDFEVDLKDNKAASIAFDFNNKTYYFYWNKQRGQFLITRLYTK